jgi:hypothetical protein
MDTAMYLAGAMGIAVLFVGLFADVTIFSIVGGAVLGTIGVVVVVRLFANPPEVVDIVLADQLPSDEPSVVSHNEAKAIVRDTGAEARPNQNGAI